MLRTCFLVATTLAIALAAPVALSAHAQQKNADRFAKCAKVCADCQLECDACSKHCATLGHAKMAQVCSDCGDCCKTCAMLCARQGPLARHMLECCVRCCEDCVAACEKFPNDRRMAACTALCKDCAKECRAVLKALEQ